MRFNNNQVKRERFFWSYYTAISLIAAVVLLQVNIILQSLVFFVLVFVAMHRSQRYGISHPISWFSIFFYLYAVSYPLLMLTLGPSNVVLERAIPLNITAYCAFILPSAFLTPFGIRLPHSTMSPASLRIVCYAILSICCILIIYIVSSGISSKREFIDTLGGSTIGSLYAMFSFAALAFSTYVLSTARHTAAGEKSITVFSFLGLATFLVLVVGFGVTGERDYIFRFLLFSFLLYFSAQYRQKYRSYYLILAALSLYIILPFSQAAKSFLLSGGIDYTGFSIEGIFKNEFSSAGRNLHYVMLREITGFNGETIIWDLKRFVGQSESTGAWFNSEVRNLFGDGGTSGWGFSLAAEGYINFGYVGPAMIMFALGLVTAHLHSFARKSELWFIFYLSYMPMMIYVLRADLANYLGLGFKVNLAMVLVLWCVRYLGALSSAGNKRKTKRRSRPS